jgi:hypothetical protein
MHYYQYQSFSKNQEQLMRQNESSGLYIENFLNQKEFDLIKKILDRNINWNEVGQVSKYHGFNLDTEYGPILKWLVPKIDSILTNWKVDFLTLQEGIEPWKVHADLRWCADKVPHKMFLLPIDVVPDSDTITDTEWLETYTITFKQRNYLSGYGENTDLGSYGNFKDWMYPKDDPNVEHLIEGYSITVEEWQKYFSHMPYEFLEGLVIDKFLKWKPRALIGWDMSALHCSDDFLAHSIKTKKCLMIATVFDANKA